MHPKLEDIHSFSNVIRCTSVYPQMIIGELWIIHCHMSTEISCVHSRALNFTLMVYYFVFTLVKLNAGWQLIWVKMIEKCLYFFWVAIVVLKKLSYNIVFLKKSFWHKQGNNATLIQWVTESGLRSGNRKPHPKLETRNKPVHLFKSRKRNVNCVIGKPIYSYLKRKKNNLKMNLKISTWRERDSKYRETKNTCTLILVGLVREWLMHNWLLSFNLV